MDVDRDKVVEAIRESAEVVGSLEAETAPLCSVIAAIVDALQNGSKVLSAGNGGSAAEALHLSEELVGRFRGERRSLPAVCLSADPTALTCIANDYGYEHVFARQLEGLGARGDVLVLFSTSGNSANLPPAIQEARSKGVLVICLLGRDGGAVKGQADHEVLVRGQSTERIQEAHQVIVHLILDEVERSFS
jgi:D-sedoheptulose 7-phosphate isomerase